MAIAVIAFPLSAAASSRVVISLVDRDCGEGEGGPLSKIRQPTDDISSLDGSRREKHHLPARHYSQLWFIHLWARSIEVHSQLPLRETGPTRFLRQRKVACDYHTGGIRKCNLDSNWTLR